MQDFLDKFRDKVVYHVSDSDLDGIGARIISEWFIKPIARTYIPYNTFDRTFPEFSWTIIGRKDIIVLFTDLTPPDMVFCNKIKKECDVIICDHHQTGRDLLGDLEDYYFDLEKCGTKILYDLIVEGKRKSNIIKEFVELVNIRDLWKQDSKLWKKGNNLHNIMYGYVDWNGLSSKNETTKYDRFIGECLRKFIKYDRFFFTNFEKVAAKNGEKKEKSALKEAKRSLQIRKDDQGNVYGYVEISSKASIVSSLLLNIYKDLDYIISYSTYKEKVEGIKIGKVSLRSSRGFNVAKVAEKWGGGGHSAASGVELKWEDFLQLKEGKINLI